MVLGEPCTPRTPQPPNPTLHCPGFCGCAWRQVAPGGRGGQRRWLGALVSRQQLWAFQLPPPVGSISIFEPAQCGLAHGALTLVTWQLGSICQCG